MQSVSLNTKVNSFEYYTQDSDGMSDLVLYVISVKIPYKEG